MPQYCAICGQWPTHKAGCPNQINFSSASGCASQRSKQNLDEMATRVVNMCRARQWSLHWTHRGAYLHLEASELIEAIRGKHGDPLSEAGDVLLVLMSIVEAAGLKFSDVIKRANEKLEHLETAPPYPGEERTGGTVV